MAKSKYSIGEITFEALQLYALGMTSSEIANKMGKSLQAVNNYRYNIIQKGFAEPDEIGKLKITEKGRLILNL